MSHDIHKQVKILAFTLLGGAVFGMGLIMGAAMGMGTYASDGKVDSPLLREVREQLDSHFVFWKSSSTLPTDKELEYGMIRGYVDSYKDPYTIFLPPREATSFTQNVQGSFGGVGMHVGTKNNNIIVIAPLKDSPAMKAGLKAGDIIAEVDGVSVAGKNQDEAVSFIRGEVGTPVKITIVRPDTGETKTFSVVRDVIKIPTLDTEQKNGVFIIQLYNFSADSAQLFKEALDEFNATQLKHLIIDLRGNPGGYLESAIQISSFFVPEGGVVVSERKGKDAEVVNHRSLGFTGVPYSTKILVLIDGGSASASEIVAGALKDIGRAHIAGETSFGKGSVQEVLTLSDGSALKVTIASWFTPKGTSISDNGIKPDTEIVASTSTPVTGKDGKPIDTQLNKAIELIKKIK